MARAEMKKKSKFTTQPTRDIYNKVISESFNYVKQNLTWKTMEPLLYYH